jgi:hypothetical protein
MSALLSHNDNGVDKFDLGYTGSYSYIKDSQMSESLYFSETGQYGLIGYDSTKSIIGALNKVKEISDKKADIAIGTGASACELGKDFLALGVSQDNGYRSFASTDISTTGVEGVDWNIMPDGSLNLDPSADTGVRDIDFLSQGNPNFSLSEGDTFEISYNFPAAGGLTGVVEFYYGVLQFDYDSSQRDIFIRNNGAFVERANVSHTSGETTNINIVLTKGSGNDISYTVTAQNIGYGTVILTGTVTITSDNTSRFYIPRTYGDLYVTDLRVIGSGYESTCEGLGGASGTFTSNDGKTITVTDGIITSIV